MSDNSVEFVTTTRLGERGTLTLPKEYRDAMFLEPGTHLTVMRLGDGLLLVPEQRLFEEAAERLASRLEKAGITEAALQATLPAVRERLAREHYPELFEDETTKKPSKSLAKAKTNKP